VVGSTTFIDMVRCVKKPELCSFLAKFALVAYLHYVPLVAYSDNIRSPDLSQQKERINIHN
jgi:hypothetical protein